MLDVTWTDIVAALGGVATPILVVVFGVILARRQSRNEQLQAVRVGFYRQLVPDLNSLMCYITFIGGWKELTPPDAIALKRRIDANFFVAAPLFSSRVSEAYRSFTELAFATFGEWGEDARIRSSAYRRRRPDWAPSWNKMFTLEDRDEISAESLANFRSAYDTLLACLVDDLDISKSRVSYTTSRVSLNASSTTYRDIDGA